ncbi:MAG: SRPBCC family protein [Povalibacter sp.]
MPDNRQLNKGLGWFSVGLGVVELLAPKSLGRMIGTGDHSTVMRVCGARELATGIALLSGRAPATAAFSRVAGDAVDLALLGAALRSRDADPKRLMLATTAVLGVTALDVYATGQHTTTALAEAPDTESVRVSVAINSTPEKLYSFWRNFENLPRFMNYLEQVTCQDDRRSHWRAKGPAGIRVEWDSEVTHDEPNRSIGWRTLPDSEVRHHGSVSFEPEKNGRGTIVQVDMRYGAPGPLSAQLARILGQDPKARMKRDLRSLKQLLETGEIASTRGQPTGARSILGKTLTRRES